MSAHQVRHNGATAAPTFGAELRRLRIGAGLRQWEICDDAGISRVAISEMEQGWRIPTAAVTERVIDALALLGGCATEDLQHLRELAFRARGECCPKCGFGSEEEP